MSRIPYRFRLFGKEWTVRWADPGGGRIGETWAETKNGARQILLHPKLRRDPVMRWRTFAHEILHALQFEMRVHRQTKGWGRDPISHAQIEKLEIPLGAFLQENLSPCCAHCSRRSKSGS